MKKTWNTEKWKASFSVERWPTIALFVLLPMWNFTPVRFWSLPKLIDIGKLFLLFHLMGNLLRLEDEEIPYDQRWMQVCVHMLCGKPNLRLLVFKKNSNFECRFRSESVWSNKTTWWPGSTTLFFTSSSYHSDCLSSLYRRRGPYLQPRGVSSLMMVARRLWYCWVDTKTDIISS